MPGEKVAHESPCRASQTDRADKLLGSGGEKRREGSSGDRLLAFAASHTDLTSARPSCPSQLSHSQSPKTVGDIVVTF